MRPGHTACCIARAWTQDPSVPLPTSRTLVVLVTRAEDVPGLWVSHCLNLDVISQGETLGAALDAVKEAVEMVLDDDLARGADPFERGPAPDECWQQMNEVMRAGVPASTMPDESMIGALVTQLTVYCVASHPVEQMPLPWQIAAPLRLDSVPAAGC